MPQPVNLFMSVPNTVLVHPVQQGIKVPTLLDHVEVGEWPRLWIRQFSL